MLKKRHVLLRTTADVERASALLRAKTVDGPPGADNVVGITRDTFRTDSRPFRGVVEGGRFRLTRRVRGRRLRVQLEGTLLPKDDGTTEVRASMAPPATTLIGLVGGSAASLLVTLTIVLQDGPALLPAALSAGLVGAFFLTQRLFEREVSATFRELRDAVPENAGTLEAVSAVEQPAEGDATQAVREPERER
jgi:hypothetical protein